MPKIYLSNQDLPSLRIGRRRCNSSDSIYEMSVVILEKVLQVCNAQGKVPSATWDQLDLPSHARLNIISLVPNHALQMLSTVEAVYVNSGPNPACMPTSFHLLPRCRIKVSGTGKYMLP